MRIQTTLRPGQRGTKKLLERYGDRLVCVRYRVDPESGQRMKTIELVVDEAEPARLHPPRRLRTPSEEVVYLRISDHDVNVCERVKAQGAWYNARLKLWRLPRAVARAMGLQGRIVEQTAQSGSAGW